MNVLGFFQRRTSTPVTEPSGSAAAARDRLTVLLSHERAVIGQSKLVEALRDEILTVTAKHVQIARDKVQVKMEGGEGISTLAIDIQLPALSDPKVAA